MGFRTCDLCGEQYWQSDNYAGKDNVCAVCRAYGYTRRQIRDIDRRAGEGERITGEERICARVREAERMHNEEVRGRVEALKRASEAKAEAYRVDRALRHGGGKMKKARTKKGRKPQRDQ